MERKNQSNSRKLTDQFPSLRPVLQMSGQTLGGSERTGERNKEKEICLEDVALLKGAMSQIQSIKA